MFVFLLLSWCACLLRSIRIFPQKRRSATLFGCLLKCKKRIRLLVTVPRQVCDAPGTCPCFVCDVRLECLLKRYLVLPVGVSALCKPIVCFCCCCSVAKVLGPRVVDFGTPPADPSVFPVLPCSKCVVRLCKNQLTKRAMT